MSDADEIEILSPTPRAPSIAGDGPDWLAIVACICFLVVDIGFVVLLVAL